MVSEVSDRVARGRRCRSLKPQAKPIKTDVWDTTHCPQCGERAVAEYGRTTFTNVHGTFCKYQCLQWFEEQLYQRCGACSGTGRVEREAQA